MLATGLHRLDHPRDDRSAFRDALVRLIAEPAALRATRAADARAYARTTFDPQRQVSAYLDLLLGSVRPAADRVLPANCT